MGLKGIELRQKEEKRRTNLELPFSHNRIQDIFHLPSSLTDLQSQMPYHSVALDASDSSVPIHSHKTPFWTLVIAVFRFTATTRHHLGLHN